VCKETILAERETRESFEAVKKDPVHTEDDLRRSRRTDCGDAAVPGEISIDRPTVSSSAFYYGTFAYTRLRAMCLVKTTNDAKTSV